jgi:hypothetical protein
MAEGEAEKRAKFEANYLTNTEQLFQELSRLWQLGPKPTVPVRISISSPLSTNKVSKFQAWLVSLFGKISLIYLMFEQRQHI